MNSRQFEFEMISHEIGHPREKKFTRSDIALFVFAGAAIGFGIAGIIFTSFTIHQ